MVLISFLVLFNASLIKSP